MIFRYLPPIIPGSPLDFISPPTSRASPLPSPSYSSPDLGSSNSSSHQSHSDTPAAAAQALYESLPLPSFPSSPLPLSPPPSSADSILDPQFEKQQQQNVVHIDHSSTPTLPLQTTTLDPVRSSITVPLRSPIRPILSPSSLPFCFLRVGSSNLSLTDKGKETVSFIIEINIPATNSVTGEVTTAGWKVEKLYSEIVKLDSLVRSKINRQELKSLRSLPDKALFKDHSPYKSDQRKVSIIVLNSSKRSS